ncbi:hypothetical protein CHU95_07385 [Niveispirillum lacus]|uniref:Uncharacterized protein n=1 Tax=Niveispirillum lacus TaxID=1981099 RepID=A0A255Z267_9PROT|nr:hypothetical protein CHU95_07385 [Niveispirillum lacus]
MEGAQMQAAQAGQMLAVDQAADGRRGQQDARAIKIGAAAQVGGLCSGGQEGGEGCQEEQEKEDAQRKGPDGWLCASSHGSGPRLQGQGYRAKATGPRLQGQGYKGGDCCAHPVPAPAWALGAWFGARSAMPPDLRPGQTNPSSDFRMGAVRFRYCE